jgi:alpha-tubulin suppressor-like RCC1 family protein
MNFLVNLNNIEVYKTILLSSIGENHVLSLTDENEIYVYGYNYDFQAGDNSSAIVKNFPTLVNNGDLYNKKIIQIEACNNFNLVLTETGKKIKKN